MTDPEDDKPLGDETHHDSGAPTDDAHAEVGDGTLQGSVPAGEATSDIDDDESVQPGTG
ncbi:hypothetical protein [Sphingomonas sp. S2-65]|uniref:hypothetical protein n=1 Tax=Sphingomonas sp. S2-65 TaxID=2903960 RepID=UPI001F318CDE|nr:hypothetical protein [Sphingomonas sp. S2-65]UYY59342.1 hypothetical protein LZ586_04455 [Sphingomonas sp. S2-65]